GNTQVCNHFSGLTPQPKLTPNYLESRYDTKNPFFYIRNVALYNFFSEARKKPCRRKPARLSNNGAGGGT
ncbi:hypothetical protein, partial [Marinobacter sp. ELB17]|uniref:hypothetical protein n=1 Tax=Marinobacter sp. ELB17 TaxID=270374 RepID=UPI001D0D7372